MYMAHTTDRMWAYACIHALHRTYIDEAYSLTYASRHIGTARPQLRIPVSAPMADGDSCLASCVVPSKRPSSVNFPEKNYDSL